MSGGIGLYLHHVGDGHRTRGTQLARALWPGVVGLGSGSAPEEWPARWVELARDDGPPRPELTLPADDLLGDDPSARGVLHWVPRGHAGLLERHARLVCWLAQERPALLVVDVSVEVTLLARLCGIPVVVVALPGERTDRAHAAAHDLAEHLLAPWPEHAHGQDWPTAWRDKTWAVGGISRYAGRVAHPAAVEPGRVLVLGGAGGSTVRPDDIERARAACPGTTWVAAGGRHARAADLWSELTRAEVVVTHAGQNAVADLATARRPAVVVAQDRPHGEQAATAAEVDRRGLAVGLARWPEDPASWPLLLDEARRRGGQGWAGWVPGTPAGTAAALLQDLAGRLARPARPPRPIRPTRPTRPAQPQETPGVLVTYP